MKRLIFIMLIAVMLLCAACGSSAPKTEDYDLTTKEGLADFVTAFYNDGSHYSLDNVTVNDDAGTGSGFIVLVNLSYTRDDSAELERKQIKLDSDDLAYALQDDAPEVNQLVIMWDTPLKYQYKRVGDVFTRVAGE